MKNQFEKVFANLTKNKNIYQAICYIENSDRSFSWNNTYGENTDINKPFAIASITKLYTTACIIILVQNKIISLEDKVERYLDEKTMSGLLIYKNVDYSSLLTIKHLLFQSSGFFDDFEKTISLSKRMKLLEEATYTFDEMIEKTKHLKTVFALCFDKAFYANINFDILGNIIENVTGIPLNEVYKKYIFEPLGLVNTYLYSKDSTFVPQVYCKSQLIDISNTVAASYASGGAVSTASELMIFLRAFFKGQLFDNTIFNELHNYRKLQATMGPIYYGAGYMQIPLKGMLTGFKDKGELIGHSGATGSFAFYYPERDLFIVGNTSQIAKPSLPIKLLLKLVYNT